MSAYAKCSVAGQMNVTDSCVNRHVGGRHGDRVAIYWEGEPVCDRPSLTNSNLPAGARRAAHALADLRIGEPVTLGRGPGIEMPSAPTALPPIVDTWWQTGAAMIAPLPGVIVAKPGLVIAPPPSGSVRIVDDRGSSVADSDKFAERAQGYLVLDHPWPRMLGSIWGDPKPCTDNCWSRFAEQGRRFAGDGALRRRQHLAGGRVDYLINASGHRISTADMQSALVGYSHVPAAVVVGAADAPKATPSSRVCFTPAPRRRQAARSNGLGPACRGAAQEILLIAKLSKTRSGKTVRRLLRDVAECHELGDTPKPLNSERVRGHRQRLRVAPNMTSDGGSAWEGRDEQRHDDVPGDRSPPLRTCRPGDRRRNREHGSGMVGRSRGPQPDGRRPHPSGPCGRLAARSPSRQLSVRRHHPGMILHPALRRSGWERLTGHRERDHDEREFFNGGRGWQRRGLGVASPGRSGGGSGT